MGCDIHSIVQVKDSDGKWNTVYKLFPQPYIYSPKDDRLGSEPFDTRHYGMFGFLADVRNYSNVPCIRERRGLPEDIKYSLFEDSSGYVWYDVDKYYLGDHSFSWLLLSELINFDYNETFCDATENFAEVSFKEFLPNRYFRDIEIMKKLDPNPDNIRVVLGFDN